MFDMRSCGFCAFEFVTTLPYCPRCGNKHDPDPGNGGVREPVEPSPDGSDPGVLCSL